MAKLIWHQEGANRIEYGVDRGVFYSPVKPGIYSNGVVWNGLTKIVETSIGGNETAYYYDGIKYLETISPREYQATISAYSAPHGFLQSLGDIYLIPGFILTRQDRTLFGLSYRSFIGKELGYKIHIVYHVMASPMAEGYSTMDADPSAEALSWRIDAVPPLGIKHRPTAHYILNSMEMNPDLLSTIEYILYGTNDSVARLPTVEELRDLVSLWHPLIIVPQSETGLAGLVSGMGDLNTTSIEGINRALPEGRLGSTPVDGIYRMEA